MHYMHDPPSDARLEPVERVLDCDVRDWAADLYFRQHVGNDYPSKMAPQGANNLLMKLMGLSNRELWIYAHHALSFFNTEHEQMDVVMESFVSTFSVSFWKAIPPSSDPALDSLQKQRRMGYTGDEELEEHETSSAT